MECGPLSVNRALTATITARTKIENVVTAHMKTNAPRHVDSRRK